MAADLGLDLATESREFLDYWLADGRAKSDWNQVFASRLEQQFKRGARANAAEPVHEMNEL